MASVRKSKYVSVLEGAPDPSVKQRWWSMAKNATYLLKNRAALIGGRLPDVVVPDSDWWLLLWVMSKLLNMFDETTVDLQRNGLTLSGQHAVLKGLRALLAAEVAVERDASHEPCLFVVRGRYLHYLKLKIDLDAVMGMPYLLREGRSIKAEVAPRQLQLVALLAARAFIIATAHLEEILDSYVHVAMDFSPARFASMDSVAFEAFCDEHRARVEQLMGEAQAATFFQAAAETQQRLVRMVAADDALGPTLRNLRNSCDLISFGDMWKPLASEGLCDTPLFELAAGLASVYPTSAEVERDFCLLRYVFSVYRKRTSFLVLEGFYQSKQFRQLYMELGQGLTQQAQQEEHEDGLTDGEASA
eukprot:GHVU01114120.1.p1 GENE.GHVU01114120.1~~GHVU01114120.1.p1  ORF type:complete len:385 (-),score=55.10 GHVU01114120.1:1204-2283(-)